MGERRGRKEGQHDQNIKGRERRSKRGRTGGGKEGRREEKNKRK